MGGISKKSSKSHHKQQSQKKDNAVEDSCHNMDIIPCLSLKGWIDDLLQPLLSSTIDAVGTVSITNGSSHTKKGAQRVKKGDSPSCLIILLWRCWLEEQKKGPKQLYSRRQENNAVDVPPDSKKKKRKNKKKQDDTSAIELNNSTSSSTSTNQNSSSVTDSTSMVHDIVTAAITSLYPCRTLQEFFQSSHFLHIPFSEMEHYIQMQLESVTCPECLHQAKSQFLLFSEKNKSATDYEMDNHNHNSNNCLYLMDPFRMKLEEEKSNENDLRLASMEEGIPLQPQQSQLYLSVRTNNASNEDIAKASSTNKYLLLHGVTVPSNDSSCDNDNIKIWMEWIFSLMIPLAKSNASCGSAKDGGNHVLKTCDDHVQPPVELLLEQLLQNDSLDSSLDKAFLDQLFQPDATSSSQVYISPRHQQMMERIRDIRTRIFTNINWKQNESRLQSYTYHTTNSQCINYRQKSHLDGIDQDLYSWLEEMTTLLLSITVDNSTNIAKLLDQLWNTYEQQLDVVLRASVKYRSEQLYFNSNKNHNANLPLLWNNEQLRNFMEEKQSSQLDALQNIHVALEDAVTSSAKNETKSASVPNTTSSTTHSAKEDLLLQRIFLSRAAMAMRTIVKGTKEEIRKEQQEKNCELINMIKEEFLLKLAEKKTFVVSKVNKFLPTLVLPESQRDLVTQWKSKFLNSWEALDLQAEEARLTLEKYLQKVVREQGQQKRSAEPSESTQKNEENINARNSTEKKGFLYKTFELFRYSGLLATVSFQKWRLFSLFVSQSHQLEQHFSVSAKQLKLYQSCAGGGTHGGRRRLAAMASVFVLRWLELKCTEWNVEESQRELLERILAEEQQLVADELTATKKADKKRKKKKKTDSGARNSNSEVYDEHPSDNHKATTAARKTLNYEPPESTIKAAPKESLPPPAQQSISCVNVEASASTHTYEFSGLSVEGDLLLISLKKDDSRAVSGELNDATDNDKAATETQELHNPVEVNLLNDLDLHQTLLSPSDGQGFALSNTPAGERVTDLPCFNDAYVYKTPQENGIICENGSIIELSFAVIGKEAQEAISLQSAKRLFDATSVQIVLEERMKALLAHGKECEDTSSKLVFL